MTCSKCGSSNIKLERRVDGHGICLNCGFQVRCNGVDMLYYEPVLKIKENLKVEVEQLQEDLREAYESMIGIEYQFDSEFMDKIKLKYKALG